MNPHLNSNILKLNFQHCREKKKNYLIIFPNEDILKCPQREFTSDLALVWGQICIQAIAKYIYTRLCFYHYRDFPLISIIFLS